MIKLLICTSVKSDDKTQDYIVEYSSWYNQFHSKLLNTILSEYPHNAGVSSQEISQKKNEIYQMHRAAESCRFDACTKQHLTYLEFSDDDSMIAFLLAWT